MSVAGELIESDSARGDDGQGAVPLTDTSSGDADRAEDGSPKEPSFDPVPPELIAKAKSLFGH